MPWQRTGPVYLRRALEDDENHATSPNRDSTSPTSRYGPPMAKGALRRHRDFRLLWGGETVSELGSQVSLLAIPRLLASPMRSLRDFPDTPPEPERNAGV